MTTFSQLVDKMVSECKRPDMQAEICTYLNQTLRELHFEPQRNNAVFFKDNFNEDLLTSLVETGFSWAIPDPTIFQGGVIARYDSVWTNGENPWAVETQPGRGQANFPFSFYRSAGAIYFRGYGGVNATISLGWYQFTKGLKYYPSTGSQRPAEYDVENGWTYSPAFDVSDATRTQARNLTSNWILDRWDTLLEEGLRAKVYKRVVDTERARTSYSLFMSLRQGLYSSEVADTTGSW